MKKALSVLLSIFMLLSVTAGLDFSAYADDLPSSGTCGDNVTYTFNSDTGTLTISGTGAMTNYSYSGSTSPFKGKTEITKVVINSGVTSIGTNVFYGCKNMTNITIPATVTSIGLDAFDSCSGLTSLTIPKSVSSIDSQAFGSCSGLTSISVDSENETYDSRNNCNAIIKKANNELVFGCKNTVIPNTVTSIGTAAFNGCTGLTSITIPSSVTNIGSAAFHSCRNLTSIKIPSGVTNIDAQAFYCCNSLANIELSDTVKTIGSAAFEYCAITSIVIPDSVTRIGNCAFQLCSKLTDIVIPDSTTSIGSSILLHSAYYKDENNWEDGVLYNGNHLLTAKTDISGKYTIKKNTKTIADDAFYSCSGLTGVEIPDSVIYLGEFAFLGCTSLTSIEIPEGITSINESTFQNSGLTSIDIPNNISSIGQDAFNCSNLNSITITNPNCDIYSYSESTISSTATIYGYKNSTAEAYATKYDRTFVALDDETPTCSISSTNSVANSQNITLSMSDDLGIAGYYWGTNSNYSSNTYYTSSSTSVIKTVSSAGTYHLTVKDTGDNVSDTVSITFYKTTLNANSGSVSPTSVLTKSGNSFTFPTPTRSGYNYKGWSTSSTATSGITSLTPTGNSTYYAVWEEKDTTKPTGSIESTNNVAAYQTIKLTLNDNVGVDGYYWGTNTNYSSNSYYASTSVYKTLASEGTYYLVVKDTSGNLSDTVSITYYKTTLNANGGSVSPTSVLTKSGNSFTFPTPTKSDCTYKGWSTSSTATSGITSLTPTGNSTYYAVWEEIDNTKPTGSVESTNNTALYQYVTLTMSDNVGIAGYYWGTNSNYSSNTYTATSSESVSKYVSSDGTYYLTVKDTSGNISDTVSITFYKTTLNTNGGSETVAYVLTKSGNTFTFPAPTRSGYNYKGWSTSSTATSGVKSLTPTGNSTYYAVWEEKDTTKPTGSITSTNNVAASQTATLTLNDNVGIAGYYWGTNTNYSSNSYYSSTSINKTITSAGTYYLVVQDTSGNLSDTVSITYYKTTLNANGGSVSPTSVLTKSGNSFTFPTPTKSDCTYKGWSTLSTATSGVKSLTPTGNSTYYAVWEVNDTTNPTGSISSTNNVDAQQTVTLSLSDNVGIAGYYWGKNSDYSKNTYFPTSSTSETKTLYYNNTGTYYLTVKDTSGNISNTVSATFYKTYLNPSGGTLSVNNILTKSGYSVTLPTPTRSGYDFVGWNTSNIASSGVKQITPTSSQTYYAIWKSADTIKPTGSISSTNDFAERQTVTLTLSDNLGIAGYYWGEDSTYYKNEYFTTSSTSVTKYISYGDAGTYYLTVKDKNDNISNTVSATFYRTLLDATGGTFSFNNEPVSIANIITQSGYSVTLPTPARSGYTYKGWNTSKYATSGSNKITPSGLDVYYTIWEENDTTKPTCSISSTNNVAASQTATLNLNDNRGIAGYYWGTNSSYSGNTYTSTTSKSVKKSVTAPGTYYLTVKDTSGNISNTVSITYYKTTLNANGGSVSPTSVLTKSGNKFTFPTPKHSKKAYNGWNTSKSATSGVKELKPTANKTYYAVWKADTTKPTGSISSTNNVANSQTVTLKLSDNVGIAGYYWGTKSTYSSNKYKSTSSTSISKTIDDAGTYYLTVKDTSGHISKTVSITFYKTTLDANGGSVSLKSVLTKKGNKFTFPTPTLSGYQYFGWSTSSTAITGNKILIPTSSKKYYAVFNQYNLKQETYSFKNYDDRHNGEYMSGHCFGMSITSAGYYTGCLSRSLIGNTTKNLYSFSKKDVKGPICDYQTKQGAARDAAIVAGGTYYLTDKHNVSKDWKEVINYVKNKSYNRKGSLQVGIRRGDGGHSVNFLYYKEVNGQARIYLYDSNFPDIETYIYKDSDGKVYQKPKATYNGAIDCVALRDVNKYFTEVVKQDLTRCLYAETGTVKIEGAEYVSKMEGYSEENGYTMYEMPENAEDVKITPLKDDASFTYLDSEYSFGSIDAEKNGVLPLESAGSKAESGKDLKVYYGDKVCTSHNFTAKKNNPTCTEKGKIVKTCSVCGYSRVISLKAKGHKVVTDKAVAPTFKKTGKTKGSHCSVCKKTLVAQKKVAKLGSAKLSGLTSGKGAFKATWKPVKNIGGYQIQYSLKKNMKSAKTKTVKGYKNKALTVKKLKPKKTYYIRIRAYKKINGKVQYSKWSPVKKLKLK